MEHQVEGATVLTEFDPIAVIPTGGFKAAPFRAERRADGREMIAGTKLFGPEYQAGNRVGEADFADDAAETPVSGCGRSGVKLNEVATNNRAGLNGIIGAG